MADTHGCRGIGLAGCYGVFDALLKPILAYVDLKPEVFQTFKEIGNAICLIRDISDSLDWIELHQRLFVVESVNPKFPPMTLLKMPRNTLSTRRLLDIRLSEIAVVACRLHHDSMRGRCTSLFSGALCQLDDLLIPFRSHWSDHKSNLRVLNLETTGSFHRLWSALSFLFGVQTSNYRSNDGNSLAQKLTASISDDDQFGHGFFFAGVAGKSKF